jgi:ribosomal protein L37AE/L43A
MGKRTQKVGIVGKYAGRYGSSHRKVIKKIGALDSRSPGTHVPFRNRPAQQVRVQLLRQAGGEA